MVHNYGISDEKVKQSQNVTLVVMFVKEKIIL